MLHAPAEFLQDVDLCCVRLIVLKAIQELLLDVRGAVVEDQNYLATGNVFDEGFQP